MPRTSRNSLCFRRSAVSNARAFAPPEKFLTMRLSRYFLPILRETPKEAEIVSHRLMLRAGLVRQQAAGNLLLVAFGRARAGENRRDRARGAGSLGRDRDPDAHFAACRSLEGKRALRGLRQGDAAHRGSPRARHALRPDERGDGDRHLPLVRVVVPRDAAQSLSHPVEVPRRGAPAIRRHARPRIPDEGCILLRHQPRGGTGGVQPHVCRVSAYLRPARPQGDSDARRHRPDRRRHEPRVHHSGFDGGRAKSSARAT